MALLSEAKVQCDGPWLLLPYRNHHMDPLGGDKSHLIGIEPCVSLKPGIRVDL